MPKLQRLTIEINAPEADLMMKLLKRLLEQENPAVEVSAVAEGLKDKLVAKITDYVTGG